MQTRSKLWLQALLTTGLLLTVLGTNFATNDRYVRIIGAWVEPCCRGFISGDGKAKRSTSDRRSQKRRQGGVLGRWWYCQRMGAAFNRFRQKYPFLVVEHWRTGDAEVYQKVTTEARAGVYNVDVSGVEINLVSELKKTGLMKKYSWPNTSGWSPQHKDREGSGRP